MSEFPQSPAGHIDPREFGRLEAQSAAMAMTLVRLESKFGALDTKLNEIDKKISEARGGWKTVATLSGIAATIGAGVASVAQYLHR
jgi:hypothetical protein